jgi:uncharacterized repeat protein (TIGR02543 family)
MRKNIYAGAAAFLLMLVGGCDNMAGPVSGPIPDQDGKAAVSIEIEGTEIQGRSVLPSAALADVSAWKLWGGKTSDPNPKDLLKEFSGSTGQTLYLETGNWDFTLDGYNGASLILRGNVTNKSISFEGPNTLSFTAAPVLDGTGTIKISINLPSGHGITQARVFKDGVDINAPITPSGDRIVLEVPHPAGDYYFSLMLYQGTDLYGVVSELIKVRMNLSSEKTYTLAREDLNLRYVITYHLNNGQLGEGVPNPGYYRQTDAAFTLPAPTRTGYTFGGWYDNSGCTGSAVTAIPAGGTADRTFYAKWTLDSYSITYNPNGGSNNAANPAAYTVESTAISLAAASRGGYTFGGWYANPELTGSAVDTIPAGSTGAKTFYARWINAAVYVSVWVNEDDGNILASNDDLSISKTGNGYSTSFTAAVTGGYAGVQWYFDGLAISGSRGAAQSIDINAADYAAGTYILGAGVTKNGASYSRDFRFTVTE